MIKKNFNTFLLILSFSLLYCWAGVWLDEHGCDIKLKWLFWNLFLALVPVLFAMPAHVLLNLKKYWRILALPFIAGWLLFLPNSCYMITDLIHLESSGLIGSNGAYLMNLKGWIEIIYLGAGIFLAVIAGLFSTSLIHQPMKLRKYKVLNFIWISVISLLCGYGVYIGRFLRLNSWDILHPRSLLKILLENIDRFTVLFSCFIAAFFFFSYLIYAKVAHDPIKN